MDLHTILPLVLSAHDDWKARWHAFTPDPTLEIGHERLTAALAELFERLDDNYPFFHPAYAGQMLKPPHPAAVAGYLAAQLINPNNHALDGGPATARMEREAVADVAAMFGYRQHLGHLTSSGTIANLEALWVARELHPGRAIAFSDQAHYTHRRMCGVIGARAVEVPSDRYGKMDLDALRALAVSDSIGTVVATAGTTALGALDPVHEIIAMGRDLGFRVHVDAAYGGFFRLLADGAPSGVDAAVFRALAGSDSLVVDPHKHGLQPYGCGCVLFSDPSVGRFYAHDSPYTYFTSTDLHLGEISLECSRAGASAAALWLTLRCLPLQPDDGLGAVLRRTRSAALRWAELMRASTRLSLLLEPELDIVTWFTAEGRASASSISERSERLFRIAMEDPHAPVYLSTLRVRTGLVTAHHPRVEADREWTTVLRSVLMKPEHADYVPVLHRRMEQLAAEL